MVWVDVDGRLVNLGACLDLRQVDGENETVLYLVPIREGEESIRVGAGTREQMAAMAADLKAQLVKAGHPVVEFSKVKPKGPESGFFRQFFGGEA